MWNFIKRNKILLSGATLLIIVALLGININPIPIPKTSHAVSIGSGQKYEVTIADKVLAAGLSADYTCNGTNDNVIWQNAINAVPANGGIVNDLTGGLYVFAGTVNVPAKVTINGIGRASYFSYNGSSPIFTSTGNGTCYQNISTDNGGINTGATTGWLEINVAVGTTLYTERSPNSSLVDNTYTGNVTGNLTGNVSATTVGATTLNAPTGRTASYVIAPSNSPNKAQADYVLSGTADDIIIQTVLNLGYPITIMTGDVYLAATLKFKANYQVINCAGIYGTTWQMASGANCSMFASDSVYNYCGIKNARLFGNKSNETTGNAIDTDKLMYFQAENLLIDNFKVKGIYHSNAETLLNPYFSNVTVSACDGDGWNMGSVNAPIMQNCLATTNGGNGMNIGATNGVFTNVGSDANGISDFTGTLNTCQGNISVGSGTYSGIRLLSSTNNTLFITDTRPGGIATADFPIDLNGCNYNTITLNFNDIESTRGMHLTNSSNNQFFGLVYLTHQAGYGNIFLENTSANNTFTGMTLHSSGLMLQLLSGNNNVFDHCIITGTVTDSGTGVLANTKFYHNVGYNPVGLITNPIGTATIGLGGTGATVTTATDYVVAGIDCTITSTDSSNTNCTLLIKDSAGNTIKSLTTTGITSGIFNLPIGYKLNWTFTGTAPTVTVFGN